ncbi:hypothetical protein P9112_002564 [Eukaryota sp. TZLM1-RC]
MTAEIADGLAFYFQQLVSLKVVPPPELTAARLIALVKPGSEFKPSEIRCTPRNQSSEKLSKIFEDKCFDKKWSRALSALSPGVKAPNNQDTRGKLKILHPLEDPIMDQNFYGTYWENYPLMASEVFSMIKKRPRGKSAGLSGISIDHVKAAIISSEYCLVLLTKFFNRILTGQLKYPEELRSSRLTALVKNSKMDKFNESRAKVLSQLLGCKMFQIPDHAYLSPHYGGLGWTKASILTSCAFVGGCRNAIFEFSERFADWADLLMTTQSSTVFA